MLIGPQISPADANLAAHLRAVRAAIAAAAQESARSEDSITLVAVSKGHDEPRIRAAAALGINDFGESYLQEAAPKLAALSDQRLTWHFIGRVQANKTGVIAAAFDWVHAIDRLKIATRLSAQRPAGMPPLNVCVHVNIGAEAAKGGVAPEHAAELVAAVSALPRLQIRGLMCILPADQSADANRRAFGAMRELLRALNAQRAATPALDTLSMGMSADFREAILEGATLLRIGTALFGPRSERSAQPAQDTLQPNAH